MLARATPAELAWIPRIRAEFRPGSLRGSSAAFCTDVGHHAASPRRQELAAISFVQKMIRRRQKPATPLLSLRWTFRAMPAALQLGVPPRRFLLFRPRPDHSQHIRLPHQNPFGLFSVGEAPDSRFLP